MVEGKTIGQLTRQRRGLLVIIWPMLAIVALLMVLASLSLDTLSAARAYVGGESRWSKGQKDAVYFLLHYAESHQEADYQAYLDAIAAPRGDQLARMELERKHPNLGVAANGFIAGLNDPDDIPGMIRLYRWFHDIGPMKSAIAVWTEGDRYIDQLVDVARTLHQTIQSGATDSGTLRPLLRRIDDINAHFTPLESRFSATLSESAREVGIVLQVSIITAAILLLGLGIRISGRMLQRSRHYEQALRRNEARLREAQALAHLGNWSRDLATGETDWSAEALRIFGFDPALPPAGQTQHLNAIHAEDRATVAGQWEASARNGRSYTIEYRIGGGEHGGRWVQEHGQCYAGGRGEVGEMIATVMDVTDRKAAEEKIQRLAHYDEVTSLPNRNLMYQHVQHLLARCQRHGGRFAMLFVDLDHFKEINDTQGHAAGDRVLKEVAARLSDCLRDSDMIARFGGDEFIVLIEGTAGRDDITRIARKICDAVATPFVVNGNAHHVTASIGISVYPEDGTDAETLCKHADMAMYQAKNLGKNRFGFFGG